LLLTVVRLLRGRTDAPHPRRDAANLTMGDAPAERLADVTAARAIGTLLQAARGDPRPSASPSRDEKGEPHDVALLNEELSHHGAMI
jgi:hypothetical protein